MAADRNQPQPEKRATFWTAFVRARTIDAARLVRQADRRFL